MQVTNYAVNGNTITAFGDDNSVTNFGKNFFEKWMHTNDKLQWNVEDEAAGVDIVKITVEEFWQAHAGYICKMIQDYLQPPALMDNSCFANSITDVLSRYL